MANTLKELASTAQIVTQTALERALRELKTYVDNQSVAAAKSLQDQIDALVGAAGGDADKLLNTFNDIKAFLTDYSEDDTLKSLLDAVQNAVNAEKTRAEAAEAALGQRVTTLENVSIMTDAQAKSLFDSVFTDNNG